MNKGKPRKARSSPNALVGAYSPTKVELIEMDPCTLNVGLRLRRERYLRNLTLEQMASYLNISTSYLGAVERGSRPLSKKLSDTIHRQLNITYDYLWEGLDVTGTMISQFVRESPGSYDEPLRHKIDVLVGVSSPTEQIALYDLIHTYLTHSRKHQENASSLPIHTTSEGSAD